MIIIKECDDQLKIAAVTCGARIGDDATKQEPRIDNGVRKFVGNAPMFDSQGKKDTSKQAIRELQEKVYGASIS